ncbi:MAG TPA: hypothetical protein VGK23_12275 [Methanomassiliicoccales archaeon]
MAIICAIVLIAIAVLGPLFLGDIHYRTSQSAIWQNEGNDIVNLVLIAPLLLIGGTLELARKSSSKYFLILTPITLMYTGISVGVGQEWSNPNITGNFEQYAWLFLILVIGGLFLLLGNLSKFTPADAPEFKPRTLKAYVGFLSLFLFIFAMMWVMEISQVMSTGDTATGSYSGAPTSFWMVRFLDLGISIPIGYLAIILMLSKPKKAYPVVLLFFGFFITMGTAVNAMALVEVLNNDPAIGGANAAGLIIFPILGVLAYASLLFLLKDKIAALRDRRATTVV